MSGDIERLCEFVCDTTSYLLQAVDDGRRLLFEGANGMLLDVNHGTYPFVTSSSTGPWGGWPEPTWNSRLAIPAGSPICSRRC